jgi:positive regulator of sigma E activity
MSEEAVYSPKWRVGSHDVSKSLIVYLCQILIIYVIVIVSLYNITFHYEKDLNLWVGLLCSAVGYLLPAPALNKQ